MHARIWPVLLILVLALTACTPRDPAAPAAAADPGGATGSKIQVMIPAVGALALQAATATPALSATVTLASPTATPTVGAAMTPGLLPSATSAPATATATVPSTTIPATPVPPTPAASPTPTALPPAPNLGGMLIYVANRQIVARPANTTTVTVLVADPSGTGSGAAPSHLRWAPSGRKLLYTIEPTGAITQVQLAVYDFDTQKLTTLGPGQDPAWNADSDRVAFSRDGVGPETVVVKTLTTGQEEALGLGRAPAWLPSGQQIAVWRDSNVWLLAYPPGGGDRQLTHEPKDPPAAWYGTGLLYHASGAILFYGARGSEVGASGNGMRLMAADLASGALHEWLPGRGNGLVSLDLSPDARYIAVGDQAHSSACASYGGVTIIDTLTGHITALPLPETDDHHVHLMGLSWAPGPGHQLALAYSEWTCTPGKEGDLGPTHLYLLDLAAPDKLQLQGEGAWPAWNRGHEGLGQAPFASSVAH